MLPPTAWIGIDPQTHAVRLFNITLIGLNATNGRKLLVSLAWIAIVLIVSTIFHSLARTMLRSQREKRFAGWLRQGIRLLTAFLMLIGLVSIWFDEPARFATFFGLVSAGLAFALQRVVTAFAGYFVILRGNTFSVGDRITMGGVRGDVISLGFIQTTIMEMGQPPAVESADPAMWVSARQYTGRIVTVTNDKVFDTPIYNYTREFPFIWEEMSFPISYQAKRDRVDDILMHAARELTVNYVELSEDAIKEMERRYVLRRTDLVPKVYMRLTDNWIEMTVRFICRDHGVRELKDKMSRRILAQFEKEGIGIASSTYDIVGFPPIRLIQDGPPRVSRSDEDGPGAAD